MGTEKTQSGGPTYGEILKKLETGPFVTLTKIIPAGALQARKAKNGGVSFYWRFTTDGSTERLMIGTYDSSPLHINKHSPTAKGYSVIAAIRASEDLASKHVNYKKQGGLPALLAEEAATKAAAEAELESMRLAKLAAIAQAKADQEAATKYSLNSLLLAYVDHLKAQGRRSHADAKSIFKLHVFEAWPKIAATPAKLVTTDEIADMLRRLHDLKKGRTANKLRSYLSAAYQTAKAAKSKPSVPLHFKGYGVSVNPAADTAPDETANRADKNPLNGSEMRTYWKSIKVLTGLKGAALRLHLLTGSQRIEQLVRLRTQDIGPDSIALFDGKGRPGKNPRLHAVPLTAPAIIALNECSPVGEYALSSTEGEEKGNIHIAATTLSRWAADAGKSINGFKTKRLRSGVETLLSSLEISEDHRGKLQSHGQSGVQNTHYDGYKYMKEKRIALSVLYSFLESENDSGGEHTNSLNMFT